MSDTKTKPTSDSGLDEKFKDDAAEWAKDVLAAGIQRGIKHIDENPESTFSQTVKTIEETTGAFTFLARGIRAYVNEKANKEPPIPRTKNPASNEIKVVK